MLRTISDKVIVKPDPPVTKVGLIHIPEQYQSTLWSGTVVAVGPDSKLQPGLRVVIDTARAVELEYQGVEYQVTREPEILGIITEEGEVLTWKNEGRLTRREWEETMRLQKQGGGVVRKTA